jgi:dihydrofolate reductase
MPKLTLIAAVGANRAIGKDNQLLWQLPEDMAHFKRVTGGHTVLMGRKTWDSLPPRFRPLPGRRNIVLTRQADFQPAGAEAATSLPAALALLDDAATAFVIGGAEIYAQCLPLADRLILTEVEDSPAADAFFPDYSGDEWQEAGREAHRTADGLGYAFVTYQRR